jgi:hypothetical protein
MKFSHALALSSLLAAQSCSGDEPVQPFVAVQGAAIDGSEDVVAVAAVDPEDTAGTLDEAGDADPNGEKPNQEPAPEPEPEPEDEGPFEITFWDVALEELDADAMLDVLLFPEEWAEDEREELAFPPDIVDLVGREIEIEGYVIPGKMVGGYLQDFMLVRDLQACCFGGAPKADEWIDVLMDEGTSAVYHRYLPVMVTGVFGLGGMQDNTGRALGVFTLAGTTLRAKD